MSDGEISTELVDYVRDLFAPSTEDFEMLTRGAKDFGMPEGWEISPDVGRLFQTLCRAVGAKSVVEFGTFAGHSALWFARALPEDGKVLSIELDSDYAAFTRSQLDRLKDSEKIEIRIGSCLEMLPILESEVEASGQKFDVIFLDADKAHYPEFLNWAEGVLRKGGLLLADNVLRSGSWNGQKLLDTDADDPRIIAIRKFNQMLATHPKFTSIIVPMRSGVAVGIFDG